MTPTNTKQLPLLIAGIALGFGIALSYFLLIIENYAQKFVCS